jgi:hypothetical protein
MEEVRGLDCFSAARKLGGRFDRPVEIEVPTFLDWERSSNPTLRFSFVLRNTGNETAIVSNQALSQNDWWNSPRSLQIHILAADAKTWVPPRDPNFVHQGILDVPLSWSEGYVKLAPAETGSTSVSLTLPIPHGNYLIKLCYWDQNYGPPFPPGSKAILRGPVAARPISLRVR